MISIIICSRKPSISPELNSNIQKTIGVKYELIVIDSLKNNQSIFSAYNKGVELSKFHYLCFMHEDIMFHTNNWGKRLIDHFNNTHIGIIGVAGSHIMTNAPSGWFQPQVTSGGCIQRIINGNEYTRETRINLSRFNGAKSIEAVALDGMWFCIPKELFRIISFDENTFKGFHCYDLDICLQIRQAGFQVRIISDILLDHFSYGNFSSEWVKDTYLFYNKWKDKLPQVAGVDISADEMKVREEMVAETFLWMSAYAQCKEELTNVRRSKAYRLGKMAIKPLAYLTKILKIGRR